MELDQALLKLSDKTLDQIKTIKFNLEQNVYYTYELKPDFHDNLLKACKILLSEGA